MVAVRGETVKALRKHSKLSRRRAAHALAGREHEVASGAVEAARQYLLRLEKREGATEMEPEEAEALAEALGVTVDALGEELLWAVGTKGSETHVGGIILVWRDAQIAANFRQHLTTQGLRAPRIEVVPTSRSEVSRGWAGPVLEDLPGEAWQWVELLDVVRTGKWRGDFPDRHVVALDAMFDLPRLLRLDIAQVQAVALVNPAAARTYAQEVERLGDLAKRAVELRVDVMRGALGNEERPPEQ